MKPFVFISYITSSSSLFLYHTTLLNYVLSHGSSLVNTFAWEATQNDYINLYYLHVHLNGIIIVTSAATVRLSVIQDMNGKIAGLRT